MAEIKVLVVTPAQLDKAEKALNKHLGRYFHVTSETMDGDDIDTVSVDLSTLTQEDDGSNWPDPGTPTGNYIINATKLKRLYQDLTQAQKDNVTARFQGDIVAWVQANWQDKSAVKFYRPV